MKSGSEGGMARVRISAESEGRRRRCVSGKRRRSCVVSKVCGEEVRGAGRGTTSAMVEDWW